MNVQSKDKEQRILNATMELIAENGLHATPMSQISKRAKVSAGSIYHYFPSKESIINRLYIGLKQEMIDAALVGYDIQAQYRDRFFRIWLNSLDYMLSKPMTLSFIEQCSTSPLISDEVQEECARYLAPILGFLAEGIESGELKNLEIPLIMALINGSLISTAKLELSNALTMTDKHRKAAVQVCWDGIRAV